VVSIIRAISCNNGLYQVTSDNFIFQTTLSRTLIFFNSTSNFIKLNLYQFVMPPRKLSTGSGKREVCASDPQYIEKRAKNNDAVKKSREKTKLKAKETLEKVTILKQENEMLEERIKLLHKELVFLKDIFFAHAENKHGLTDVDMEIQNLLDEDDESEMQKETLYEATTSVRM